MISSIQDAIAASVSGDRIEVGAGVYTETLDPGGKDLTIIGTGSKTTILSPPTAAWRSSSTTREKSNPEWLFHRTTQG